MTTGQSESVGQVTLASARGRWLIVATAIGSGVVFLDGSVVNVALPSISAELGGGFATAQWVLDGYLLALSALLLLGGALGDRYGRKRFFALGLAIFTAGSVACGAAPTAGILIAARVVQGVGGALLVPGSLALIAAVVVPADRGRAIGAWAGLSGLSTAIGPLLGGWLVDSASWRWIFLINVPLAVVAFAAAVRHVPESSSSTQDRLDLGGAVTVTGGLAGVTLALIEVPSHGWTVLTTIVGAGGVLLLAAFVLIERTQPSPLLPLTMFRSAQFSGANAVTFFIYAALSGGLFLLTLQLQLTLGYSALAAGLGTLPITLAMLVLSSKVGALARRTGPRIPLVAGPLLAALGFVLLAGVGTSSSYLGGVLPGVVVFGLGLVITVVPLTSAVLVSVEDRRAGAASGANNAISRVAGLIAVAVLPVAAGVDVRGSTSISGGFSAAMLLCAGACAAGAVIALVSIRLGGAPVHTRRHPGVSQACLPAASLVAAGD